MESRPKQMTAPIRILMVEDDPSHAELTKMALMESGINFSAIRVETRKDFEAQLAEFPPDLVLSDYTLPAFDGLSALRIVRSTMPDVPFIFVTGTMGEEVAIETMKIGATDYVLKTRLSRIGPSVHRALRETVERKERRQAEAELRQKNHQLRALTAHLQNVREEERTRIARRVHDELGQALTGLKLDVSWLAGHLPKGSRALNEKALALSTCIDETIQAVRKISTELRPGILDNLGLVAAIEWQAQDFQLRTGIRCVTRMPATETMWDQDLSTAFFRILQETLTNVIHHAGATEVTVALTGERDSLVMLIADNGRGISEAETASGASIGLIGMRERAALLGGGVTFAGIPGKGTSVAVRIPLSAAKPPAPVHP
jgi:two-component system, NarL family, sensor histidine kinase UhpB